MWVRRVRCELGGWDVSQLPGVAEEDPRPAPLTTSQAAATASLLPPSTIPLSLSLCNICNTQVKDADVQVNIQETDSSERFFKCFDFLSPKVNILFTGRCSSHLVLNWKSLHGNPLWSPLINCWTISDAQVQLICEPADSSFQSLRQTLKIQFSNIFVVINWEKFWLTNCRPVFKRSLTEEEAGKGCQNLWKLESPQPMYSRWTLDPWKIVQHKFHNRHLMFNV